MSRYRKIDPRIWNDEKFRSFSDDAQLVWFFVLTHPAMTPLGAMRSTIPGLAAEKGWSLKAFAKAFGEASRKGMICVNEKAAFIRVKNFLKYNPPENANVVKSWLKCLDDIPECQQKDELLQDVEEYLKAYSKDFQEAFAKARRKSMAIQEQEQEQDLITSSSSPMNNSPQRLSEEQQLGQLSSTLQQAITAMVNPEFHCLAVASLANERFWHGQIVLVDNLALVSLYDVLHQVDAYYAANRKKLTLTKKPSDARRRMAFAIEFALTKAQREMNYAQRARDSRHTQ